MSDGYRSAPAPAHVADAIADAIAAVEAQSLELDPMLGGVYPRRRAGAPAALLELDED